MHINQMGASGRMQMMQNLLLQEGDLVNIRSANLPKGRFVKLQPHTKDFLDISNPRAVLETTLRGFSCLTVGDTICLHYNNKRFYIDIIEAKPQARPFLPANYIQKADIKCIYASLISPAFCTGLAAYVLSFCLTISIAWRPVWQDAGRAAALTGFISNLLHQI